VVLPRAPVIIADFRGQAAIWMEHVIEIAETLGAPVWTAILAQFREQLGISSI